ncbi:MAG: YdjY domain-containing protein [Thermoguttaceae bacterium]|nr:YdjY domain-containing protein [Thermoguttaceae bacterium]
MKKSISFQIFLSILFLGLSGLLLVSTGCTQQKPQENAPRSETQAQPVKDSQTETGEDSQAETEEETQAEPVKDSQAETGEELQAQPVKDSQAETEEELQAETAKDSQAETGEEPQAETGEEDPLESPDSTEAPEDKTAGTPNASETISQEEIDKYINDDEYMFEHLKLDEPIFSAPDGLVRLLPDKPLWIDKERKHVVLQGWVCQNRVMLEFFLCYGPGGIRTFPYKDETGKPAKMLQFNGPKCHESIFSTEVSGRALHTALLALGVEQGEPVKFQPEFVPPTGGKVKVTVLWRKPDGSIEKHSGQELVVDPDGKPLKSDWVFAGSLFFDDSEGKKRYAADMEGEFFGVSNFPSLILDVAEESTSSNDSLVYTANEKNLPERGTPVTIILEKAE